MNNEEILSFVKRRFHEDNHWTYGNCYWAAFILCTQFPELSMYYIIGGGHFVAGNGKGDFYDGTGKVNLDDGEAFLLSDLKKNEPCLYSRLMRDCKD